MKGINLINIMVLLAGVLAGGLAYGQPPAPAPAVEHAPPTTAASWTDKAKRSLAHAIAEARPLLDRYGYAASFGAVMVEGMGIPAPGQTLLVASALDAAKGGLNIGSLLALTTLAAVLGNSIGYWLGRWGGKTLLDRIKVNPRHQQKMERFYNQYGGWVIVIGRFVDGLRQLNGMVAGILEMPWRRFMIFNVLGAVLWTSAWGLGTYLLERNIAGVFHGVERFKPWAIPLSLAAFIGLLIYLLWRRRIAGPTA